MYLFEGMYFLILHRLYPVVMLNSHVSLLKGVSIIILIDLVHTSLSHQRLADSECAQKKNSKKFRIEEAHVFQSSLFKTFTVVEKFFLYLKCTVEVSAVAAVSHMLHVKHWMFQQHDGFLQRFLF